MEKDVKAKKAVKRYTEEEFKKLPKAEQERILKDRAERKQYLQNLAKEDAFDVKGVNPSERQFNSKFNRMYNYVRKSLSVLRAKKITKTLTGEALYNETLKVFEIAKEL